MPTTVIAEVLETTRTGAQWKTFEPTGKVATYPTESYVLTRDQILRANDLPREFVKIPEWDGGCYVRAMCLAERDAFAEQYLGTTNGKQVEHAALRARLVQISAVDEAGQQLFTPDDRTAIAGKSAQAIDRICTVALRLSGLSGDAENPGKNLPETTAAASASG